MQKLNATQASFVNANGHEWTRMKSPPSILCLFPPWRPLLFESPEILSASFVASTSSPNLKGSSLIMNQMGSGHLLTANERE